MSSHKNMKKSIATFQLQLHNNTQISASAIRYKNHSKLYCLNLSKILLYEQDPEQCIQKEEQKIYDPFELVVTNGGQNYSNTKLKPIPFNVMNKGNVASKTQLQRIKQIKGIIDKEEKIQQKYESQLKNEIKLEETKQDSLTAESPSCLRIKGQTIRQQDSTEPNYKEKLIQQRKKLLSMKTMEKQNKKEESLLLHPHRTSSLSKESYKISKKNLNNAKSFSKPQDSKKNLLPQIKLNPQKNKRSHTYSLNQKSNIPLFAKDPIYPKNIKSQSYAVIEYPSGDLVISNKSLNQYEIASLTKIMTFYTVQKIAEKYNIQIHEEKVQINDHATEMTGTSAEIMVGQVYTVEQLLYGLMLPSGNDAATALAQWGGKLLLKYHHKNNDIKLPIHSKSLIKQSSNNEQHITLKERIKAFINQMNYNAKNLGLKSTRYANQHGLSHNESKSTAIDTARLCLECLSDQFFKKVISTQIYKCIPHHKAAKSKTKREVIWKNTNKLLRRQGFMGIKTGITVTAGPCLAAAYKFRDKIYICVILRALKISRRFKETRKLLAWSLQKLYKDSLTLQEQQKITRLKKNNPQLDSDYSDQEQQFNYQSKGLAEFQKRSYIINYQM